MDAPMDASELVASFGTYVDKHEATVLVGAGLSTGAGYPNWSGLLETVHAELDVSSMRDLPLLAQYYINEYGDAALQDLIRRELHRDPQPQPSRCHQLLASLPLAEIWTTNYDSLVERAVGQDARVYVGDDELAQPSEGSGCRVYKMHGSLDDPDSPLIVARDHYIRYPDTHHRFWALLQASFLTKSFLFLGFSFNDPNFDHVFQVVRRARDNIHREHFALMRKYDRPDADRTLEFRLQDLRRVGIRVATVENHDEVELHLQQLVARCNPCRVFLAGSQPGSSSPAPPGRYPSSDLDPELSAFAELLGSAFSHTSVALSSASKFGAQVGYELLKTLLATGTYQANRFVLVRRHSDLDLDSPSRRFGRIQFEGAETADMRSAALSQVRAVLAVGGGSGVADELARARRAGLGVVPVGKFGGSALQEWNRVNNSLDDYRLGGLPVEASDFRLLRDGSPEECAHTAARLAERALYIRRQE